MNERDTLLKSNKYDGAIGIHALWRAMYALCTTRGMRMR